MHTRERIRGDLSPFSYLRFCNCLSFSQSIPHSVNATSIDEVCVPQTLQMLESRFSAAPCESVQHNGRILVLWNPPLPYGQIDVAKGMVLLNLHVDGPFDHWICC